MSGRPIVYVAGPYTTPDPVTNTQVAVLVSERLWELGFLPYIPHLSMLSHLISPHEYDYWLEQGLAWVKKSDVVYRLKGESPGADEECVYAARLDILVFYDMVKLNGWIIKWRLDHEHRQAEESTRRGRPTRTSHTREELAHENR